MFLISNIVGMTLFTQAARLEQTVQLLRAVFVMIVWRGSTGQQVAAGAALMLTRAVTRRQMWPPRHQWQASTDRDPLLSHEFFNFYTDTVMNKRYLLLANFKESLLTKPPGGEDLWTTDLSACQASLLGTF